MNTSLQRVASSTVACTSCACVRCNKLGALLKKTWNDGMECIEKQSAHRTLPLPHTMLIRQHTANQNDHTACRPLEQTTGADHWSRQRPRGSKSFQRSWTHRTYLFPTPSESPQTLQTSNSWASVFLPLGKTIGQKHSCQIWITINNQTNLNKLQSTSLQRA